jgi:hypothetical protein
MASFFSDDLPLGQAPTIRGIRLSFRCASASTDAIIGTAEGFAENVSSVSLNRHKK